MSSITKSIQNEYVLLMENAFSEKYKYAFRNLELKELRRFILKELISSPELDNQLTNLMVLLNKFWDTHAAALITEVRASKRRMWIRVSKRLSPLSELQNISQKKQRTRVKPTEPKTYATNRSQWPVFLCLRGVCCV